MLNLAFSNTKLAKRLLASSLGVLLTTGGCWALPTGTNVVNGSATVTQRGNTVHIDVATRQSILEHENFDIARNERVNFRFAQGNSVSLNRILDGNPTQIHGRLTGNGTILLVNPAGIVFGANAVVNVSGLVASTLNITNDSFLSGNMQFTDGNSSSTIVNDGRIYAKTGATFLAKQIQNSGTIQANRGAAQLIVGNTVTMATNDGVLAEVTVDEALASKVRALQNAILNTGTIRANTVKLQAALTKQLYNKVINNTGRIQANTVADVNGTVELIASHGNIENSGKVLSNHTIAIDSGKHVFNHGQIGQGNTKAVTLTANKNIRGTGTVYGRDVSLTSEKGSIGNGGGLNTNVRNLTLSASNGSATINEANSLRLASADVKNNLTVTSQRGTLTVAGDANAGRHVKLTANNGHVVNTADINGRSVTVNASRNAVNKGDITTTNGNIKVNANTVRNDGDLNAAKHVKLTANNGHVVNTADINGRSVTVNASRNTVNKGDITTTNGNIKVSANTVRNDGTMNASKRTIINAQRGINGSGTISADGHIKLTTQNGHIGRRNQPLQLIEGDTLKSATAKNGNVYLNRVAAPVAPTAPPAAPASQVTRNNTPANPIDDNSTTLAGRIVTVGSPAPASINTPQSNIINQRPVGSPNLDYRMVTTESNTSEDPVLLLQLADDDDDDEYTEAK